MSTIERIGTSLFQEALSFYGQSTAQTPEFELITALSLTGKRSPLSVGWREALRLEATLSEGT